MKAQAAFVTAPTLVVLLILSAITVLVSLQGQPVVQSATDIDFASPGQDVHNTSLAQESVFLDCEAIHVAHPDWGNGYYTIDPDGEFGNPSLEAYCDMSTDGGGWTVIDYDHASGWRNYFTSWQVIDNNRMATPTGAGLPSPSWDYWMNWFILADSHTRLRVSPTCREVSSADFLIQAYLATGNFYGCLWYRRNCDMDPATQECYECLDNWAGGRMGPGTCSHLVKNDDDRTARGISLPYNHSCSHDWWNVAPSTGVAGQYCVAYNNGIRIHAHYCYLPLICTPLVAFPLYIGDAIPKRAVAYQGEVFFTKSVQVPDDLPSSGHFYFSAQPDIIAAVVVDDELAVLLDGTEFLTYDFSTSGLPHPAFVEMPRSIMERLAGRTITIEYRDVYGFFVSASTMWLIWVP